jgi:predicted NAD-dependent protein-ADP-ribosyltransferase YbiA (DUF1768 family)
VAGGYCGMACRDASTHSATNTITAYNDVVGFYYPNRNDVVDVLCGAGFLGNFYPCTFNVDGVTVSCAESAYQMLKFSQLEHARIGALTGEGAFNAAKGVGLGVMKNRDASMMKVLVAKFAVPSMRHLLNLTGTAYLLEHSCQGRETYWSDGHDGSGANRLGLMLMEIRDGDQYSGHTPKDALRLLTTGCKHQL